MLNVYVCMNFEKSKEKKIEYNKTTKGINFDTFLYFFECLTLKTSHGFLSKKCIS